MAEAAFKSTSRRTTTTANNGNSKNAPPRRSRSVSAVPRSSQSSASSLNIPDTTPSSSSSDFLIKRENPLYWTSHSSSSLPEDNDRKVSSDLDASWSKTKSKSTALGENNNNHGDSRGRSVSRSDKNGKKEISVTRRSLSRAPAEAGRRGRSVSRGPCLRGARSVYNAESEFEQEGGSGSLLGKFGGGNDSGGRMPVAGRKGDSARSSSRTRSDGSLSTLPSSPRMSWEDGGMGGGGTFSEAEERTIRAVCEQMKSFQGDGFGVDASSQIYETVRSEVKRAIADIQNDLESAIRRSNATAIATANVADIPPDLVNPSAVELVLDIRREYANKLEQSQERAHKLREDLAIEEHRGLELSRILKEVLPDPKSSNGQKSRPGRKSSIERRKMSKRLTEEAMAYFDECISLSTFDSSDFSSPEDPPVNLFGGTPICESSSLPQTNHFCDKQELSCASGHDISGLSASSITKEHVPVEVGLNQSESQWDHRSPFLFDNKLLDTFELEQEISNYIKSQEKEVAKGTINSTQHLDQYDLDKHRMQASESLLFDRVYLKNRIESGSMLLCDGGGFEFSLSPFASIM